MSLRIVVVPINHGAGVTTACLGLTHALDERRVSVGYVKPFGRSMLMGEDPAAELFRLATPLRPVAPMPFSQVEEMLAAGRQTDLMEEVLRRANDTLWSHRVVIVEGLAPDLRQVHSTHLNVETARTFDADVLLVASAAATSPERLVHQVSAMAHEYRVPGGSRVIGVVLNRIPIGENDGRYQRALADAGFTTVAALTDRPEFTWPRVADIVHQLGFETINAGDDHRRVSASIVAAQSIPGFLSHLTEGRLVIVPGDRHEVLLSAALAEQSGTHLAAVLLTAGVRPDPDVMRLCRPALQNGLPVLFTDELTFEATSRVVGLDPDIPADDEDRARLVMRGAAEAYDETWLDEIPQRRRIRRVTPAAFRLALATEATRSDTCIAVTDAEDPRVLRAVCALHDRGIQRCLLVGEAERIETVADACGLVIPFGLRIVDPGALDPGEIRRIDERLGALGITGVDASESLVVGLDLVARGEADGLVTGLENSTEEVISLATTLLGLREDVPLLTSAHVLNLPDEVVLYTDCLLHPDRPADTLAAMALSAVEVAENVGITPRVALVTSAEPLEGSEESRRVDAALGLMRDRRPDVPVEGPVAFNAASRRSPKADAGGNATVFAFTDLGVADTTVWAVSRSAGVSLYGPILLGLARPVNIVPSSATPVDIADMIVGTAVQVGHLA